MNDILIFDIETDSLNIKEANVKWFGAYSYKNDKYYLLDYRKNCQIKDLIKSHKVLIGFNNKGYDQPILEKYGVDFKFKIIIDLYEISAPRGDGGYGLYNKNRLPQMGYKLKSYSLKNIIEKLNLDSYSKGDIDYNIFRKEEWTQSEIKEIKKYLKQDIILTKKLYEWYEEQFKPLKMMLPLEERRKLTHIKSTLSSLSYQIICNKAGLLVEWNDKKPEDLKSFSGGHHIDPRWNMERGNIIEIDFASAYPHALMMGNLYSPINKGWSGGDYYKIDGVYDDKRFGKVETALRDVMLERFKAKRKGDNAKNLSYKIVINSLYGLTGNYKFKSLYNPIAAADCTSIVRTWMKKLAKTLEENGFICLYGFTDSIFIKIPIESNKEKLLYVVNKYINEVKAIMPFPQDTFTMEVEEEIKFIWFYAKNCYLFVTTNNEVKYKSTLLNSNTPRVVMNVFEKYIKPKIISELDVSFTKDELLIKIKEVIKSNTELAAEEWNVSDIKNYKVKTSMQYQISELYGKGKHLLIPNIRNVGVGKTSKLCSITDFKNKKLNVDDIDFKKILSHVKPFITKSSQRVLDDF